MINKTPIIMILFVLLAGCVSYDQFDTNTVEGIYGLAQELKKDGRYEESLIHYRDLKNRFPYSRYATESELQIAEVLYEKEAFIEAQGSYQLFKELHPEHKRIDYVTFMIGECAYHQLPSTIDRDLSVAPQAIAHYRNLISEFPQSEQVGKARERIAEVAHKLAQKELYIADFYFRTDNYKSALARYEQFMGKFPKHKKMDHALFRAGMAANKSGSAEKKALYLKRLLEQFPQSSLADQAKKAL